MEEEASSCSPQDPMVIRAGVWTFSLADSILTTVDGGNDSIVYKIEHFSGNSFSSHHAEQLGINVHYFTETMSRIN
jgi:hypothetical protein